MFKKLLALALLIGMTAGIASFAVSCSSDSEGGGGLPTDAAVTTAAADITDPEPSVPAGPAYTEQYRYRPNLMDPEYLASAGLTMNKVVLNADPARNPFAVFEQLLNTSNPVEGATDSARRRFPDTAGDGTTGTVRHIQNYFCDTLGKDVFRFEVHDEHCADGCYIHGPADRQRIEMRPGTSQATGVGYENEITAYTWSMRIDKNFPTPTGFCHIFQLKATQNRSGSDPLSGLPFRGNESGSAILYITISTGNVVQFRHTPIGADANLDVLATVPLERIRDKWVHIELVVFNSEAGWVTFTMSDLATGEVYMHYDNPDQILDMWRRPEVEYRHNNRYSSIEVGSAGASNQYNRPKWGIYRRAVAAYERDGIMPNHRYNAVDVRGASILLSDLTIKKLTKETRP